jgi:hypothetical protein
LKRDGTLRHRNISSGIRMKALARVSAVLVVAVLLGPAALPLLRAAPIITNGGFETGFTGWTIADQPGSEGTFMLQTGTTSPLNGDSVPAPPEGAQAAMTDAFGPGSHVLYQDFVALGCSGVLRFDLFIGNRADRFATPATLDFSTPALNQQARVDILRQGADPFSVAAGDILLNLFLTQVGDPLVDGYFTVTSDIGALLAAHTGEALRLRFAETDNIFIMQFGVDNVSIVDATPVSEPATALLVVLALTALAGTRRRR